MSYQVWTSQSWPGQVWPRTRVSLTLPRLAALTPSLYDASPGSEEEEDHS